MLLITLIILSLLRSPAVGQNFRVPMSFNNNQFSVNSLYNAKGALNRNPVTASNSWNFRPRQFSDTSHAPAAPGRYLVKLRSQASNTLDDYEQAFNGLDSKIKIGNLRLFGGSFTASHLQKMNFDNDIEEIIPDYYITTAQSSSSTGTTTRTGLTVNDIRKQSKPPFYGMVRISHRHADAYKDYIFPRAAGLGVDCYVLDTGVQADVADFGGRVTSGVSTLAYNNVSVDPFFDDPFQDLSGHGTNIASLIGGRYYGVAKLANIIAVKVIYFDDTTSLSYVLAGISYVEQAAAESGNPSLMNLSLTQQSHIEWFDLAIQQTTVPIFTAAGNGYTAPNDNITTPVDACNVTPAGSPGAFAVAAIDSRDTPAYFSNYGRCVKLYAPGVDAIGAIPNSQSGHSFDPAPSGTSQATAIVSGVAALYLSLCPRILRINLYFALVRYATTGMVSRAQAGTANRIVYVIPGPDYFQWCSSATPVVSENGFY